MISIPSKKMRNFYKLEGIFILYIMANTLIILIILLILFFVKMQISFNKSKSNHLNNIQELKEVINNLVHSNNELNRKVRFVKSSEKKLKISNQNLAQEILALQHEFLNIITKLHSNSN